jgi:hypothetical protein
MIVTKDQKGNRALTGLLRRSVMLLGMLAALGCRGERNEFPNVPPQLPVASDALEYVPVIEPPDDFPAGMFPSAEEWAPECKALALAAERPGGRVTLPTAKRGMDFGSGLSGWDLPCPGTAPVYELLVDETGAVVCARILRITYGKPPEGLYDAVRRELVKARFLPATLDGEPVMMRLMVTLVFKCK